MLEPIAPLTSDVNSSVSKNPFRLGAAVKLCQPWRTVAGFAEKQFERITGLDELAQAYDLVSASGTNDFVADTLKAFNISYRVSPEECSEIPASGPAIIVANHPFGGIEGLLALDFVRKIRPDVRAMANHLLGRIQELREHFFLVDPFGTESATRRNRAPLRDILAWLQGNGLLIVFPSGTVSHFQWKGRVVADPPWEPTVARIIRLSKAPVVPMFFHGRNGWLFQTAGMVHPKLRTLQLPKQLANKRGHQFRIELGTLIPAEKLRSYPSDEELLSYLRLRTYILSSRTEPPSRRAAGRSSLPRLERAPRRMEPVVPPVSPDLLAEEIEALPPNQLIVDQGEYCVAVARAQQIPAALREIGRLRELTFRAVSEGTGKSIDLDRFDNYYLHLFTWHREKREIIGSYRMVDADLVRRTMGVKGLYTHTLFAYKDSLIRQMGQTLEVGRSFVRVEYQRNFSSLHFLWKGIAQYVVKNPQYHGLFGTVSISSDYDVLSRYLIVSFLRENKYIPELAKLIRARNPVRGVPLRGVDVHAASVVVKDIADVSELIAEIEKKHKTIPILLRQYLKLDGKLLGFNIDKNFGDVLDGLIYVDMRESESKILERYMTTEGRNNFLQYHGRLPKQGSAEYAKALG